MRIALLSALADPAASAGERAALRRFAGKTVLSHQIDCAAHLKCEKVVCLTSGAVPEMAQATTYAERSGIALEQAATLAQVVVQVTAADEVYLFADGLLPDRAAVVAAIGERPGVLAFPEEPALGLGYERLDADRAWSGVLRTRGEAVARLADLPPDCDLSSSLLRIALQSGTRVIDLDPGLLNGNIWQRRVERQAGQASEWRWIAQQIRPAPFTAPARAVAERAGLRWAHDAGGGRWALAPHAVAAATAVGAAATWWLGRPVFGLALMTIALAALAIAEVFAKVEQLGRPPRSPAPWWKIARVACDALLAMLLGALCLTVPWWLGVFLPIVMLAILHLGESMAPGRWRPLFGDRILLSGIFAAGAFAGVTLVLVTAVVVLALALLLWWALREKSQITGN